MDGGREDEEPTCHARARAKPSRIDGVIANRYAVPMIKKYQIEKDINFPTHSVAKVHLCLVYTSYPAD